MSKAITPPVNVDGADNTALAEWLRNNTKSHTLRKHAKPTTKPERTYAPPAVDNARVDEAREQLHDELVQLADEKPSAFARRLRAALEAKHVIALEAPYTMQKAQLPKLPGIAPTWQPRRERWRYVLVPYQKAVSGRIAPHACGGPYAFTG